MMKVTAVIPAYNEARNIREVVTNTKEHVNEVIVVDDGSFDNTSNEARVAGADFVLRHMVNMGKGLAMTTGFEAALHKGADVVVFIDADGQHDPRDIGRMVAKLNADNLDMVTGIRQFNHNMPFVFRFGNQFLVNAFNMFFGTNIKDLSNGYRAIKADTYANIRWNCSGYDVETEMLANAAKNKLRIGQIHIETRYLDKYKGTTIFDGIKIFLNMLRWKLRG